MGQLHFLVTTGVHPGDTTRAMNRLGRRQGSWPPRTPEDARGPAEPLRARGRDVASVHDPEYRVPEGEPDGESTRHASPMDHATAVRLGPSIADRVQVAVGGVDGSAGVSARCRRRRVSTAAEAASTRAAALIATRTQSEVPPEALLPTVARPAGSGAAVCVGHGVPVAAGRCGSGWSGVPPGGRAAMPSDHFGDRGGPWADRFV
jgi:hypothetical protein